MKNLGWLYMYVRGLFSHKKYTAFSDLKDILLETQKIIPLIYEVLCIYTFMYLQKKFNPAYCEKENWTYVSLV